VLARVALDEEDVIGQRLHPEEVRARRPAIGRQVDREPRVASLRADAPELFTGGWIASGEEEAFADRSDEVIERGRRQIRRRDAGSNDGSIGRIEHSSVP